MAIQIIHKHSSVVTDGKPKLPTSSQIEYGELAVNYAKDNETISLKNSENEIVEFKSTKYLESIIKENEEITAASLTDLDERVSAVDGKISENNEAISASLNDLNERIIILDADLSNKSDKNHTHEGVYATYNDLNDYVTQNDLSTLRNDFNTLVSGDTKNTIESFKEVTAFLSGVTDTETLDGILAGLATKESVNNLISEIETNEEITAASLTDLDGRVSAVDGKISENNEAISASLNDLNERITILGADLDNYATSDDLSDYTIYNDFTGHTNDNSIHLTIGTGATNAAAGNHKHTSEDITDSISLSVQILPNTTELVQGKAVHELVSATTTQLQGQIKAITDDYAKKTDIPTNETIENWGFTKNTGTYSKPSNGIPKSDLSSDVQTSLGKADVAEENAKNYTNNLNTIMDNRVKVFESWNFATESDIDEILNGTYTPSPEEPNQTTGTITEDNSIVIDESQLENGTYTLKYIDSEDNVVENFNEITTFEINK